MFCYSTLLYQHPHWKSASVVPNWLLSHSEVTWSRKLKRSYAQNYNKKLGHITYEIWMGNNEFHLKLVFTLRVILIYYSGVLKLLICFTSIFIMCASMQWMKSWNTAIYCGFSVMNLNAVSEFICFLVI